MTTFGEEITAEPDIEVKGTAVLARWSTNLECSTVLEFGINPNNLNRIEKGAVRERNRGAICPPCGITSSGQKETGEEEIRAEIAV